MVTRVSLRFAQVLKSPSYTTRQRLGSAGCLALAPLAARPLTAAVVVKPPTAVAKPDAATRTVSTQAAVGSSALPSFVDGVLRGMGQVVFCNSAISGGLITAGLCYGDPWLASLAVLGCSTATLCGIAAGAPAASVKAGLLGYNGALVGCAFAVFLGANWSSEEVVAATAVGGAASARAAMGIGRVLTFMPQWTLSFNLTALMALAFVKPLASSPAPGPALVPAALSVFDWSASLLTGVSQIFVVNDAIAGAMILSAIAVCNPMWAAMTLAGSLLGVVAALAVGADMAQVKDGLWGFNPALTALAASVFFVPGRACALLAMGGALATALLAASMSRWVSDTIQCPALTLPFCTVATAVFLLGSRVPGLLRVG